MSPPIPPPIPVSALLALIVGGAVLVVATALALRRGASGAALAWLVIAGFAQVILGLAAGLALPSGDGSRAAVLQALVACLAGALGLLCSSSRTGEGERASGLATAGAGTAYLLLLGLPPAAGFHAKVLLCHALLQAGWAGMAILVLAASGASVLPALWAVGLPGGPPKGSPPRARMGPARGAATVLLIAVALLLGLYPHWAMTAARWAAGVVLGQA
jgi:NADH:ubiquinone oxidoreductase subunit 2 (subunit N)